jgi:hypothetical protein
MRVLCVAKKWEDNERRIEAPWQRREWKLSRAVSRRQMPVFCGLIGRQKSSTVWSDRSDRMFRHIQPRSVLSVKQIKLLLLVAKWLVLCQLLDLRHAGFMDFFLRLEFFLTGKRQYGKRSGFRNVVFFAYLEFREVDTVHTVHRPTDAECLDHASYWLFNKMKFDSVQRPSPEIAQYTNLSHRMDI